jgi:Fe-S cluster biosynthesis and repair protein YggX
MADMVKCSRCTNERHALEKPPWPDDLGRLVQENTCRDCWSEWLAMQIKIINEYRLNMGDPNTQKTLTEQLKAFLNLGD